MDILLNQNPSDAEDSKEKSDINVETNESEEAWKQTLALFKEKALVMQSVSQEAYEQYSKKAAVVFKEASEQLKIQAEKAKQDLSVVAKEVSEEGREYISKAAENPSVKDVVETFASSTEDLDEISEVRDFYLGIPYGTHKLSLSMIQIPKPDVISFFFFLSSPGCAT